MPTFYGAINAYKQRAFIGLAPNYFFSVCDLSNLLWAGEITHAQPLYFLNA